MGWQIVLNGVAVDGYVTADGGGIRVRVSTDEWERLGLAPGQRVRVEGPGREPGAYLLTAADESPPLVWLRFRPFASRAAG